MRDALAFKDLFKRQHLEDFEHDFIAQPGNMRDAKIAMICSRTQASLYALSRQWRLFAAIIRPLRHRCRRIHLRLGDLVVEVLVPLSRPEFRRSQILDDSARLEGPANQRAPLSREDEHGLIYVFTNYLYAVPH